MATDTLNQSPGSKQVDFDVRLTTLERHAIATEKRLDHVDKTLHGHGTLLSDIKAAVTKQEATRGPGIGETIRTASSLATAGAIIAALLIYVITSVMQGPLVTLTERQAISLKAADRVSVMNQEIAVFNERLATLTRRLDGGEFVRNWDTRIAKW
jgi:hypothetical protein